MIVVTVGGAGGKEVTVPPPGMAGRLATRLGISVKIVSWEGILLKGVIVGVKVGDAVNFGELVGREVGGEVGFCVVLGGMVGTV